MHYRFATIEDAPALAHLNHALIRDEGHSNPMSVVELASRMAHWLAGEYQAVAFEEDSLVIGYALFRREPEHIYLRQFFVLGDHRRRGIGREAICWLRERVWGSHQRVRVEVLIGNRDGISFWRAVGFKDYCLTLES